MITNILDRETCAHCQICCKYDDNDVWDAPGFTEEELYKVLIVQEYPYYMKNKLFYLKMEPDKNNTYMCPLLTNHGCSLNTNKPFKCAIWPLYVVNFKDKVALAVSDVCPSVYALTNDEILLGLKETIKDICIVIRKHPELVEPFRENFRFITYINI